MAMDEQPIVNIDDVKSGKKVFLGKQEDELVANIKAKDKRKI